MKRILSAVLLVSVLTTPAIAARLYLKEGGVIQAKRVWRSGGRVYVLATRDTMTSFAPSEVNMKLTFPKRHRTAKKVSAVQPQAAAVPPAGAAAAVTAPATPPKAADKKPAVALPALPKLPEKSPDSLVPSSGGGGTIKQHKKEMAEKTGE